ncbi:MAG TPA: alpha/beta fold hydrolase [Thermoanaerobaculia bacterium]|nr:alpha/beta fold hydrolase [Thermoanaerobaculia bacterium]
MRRTSLLLVIAVFAASLDGAAPRSPLPRRGAAGLAVAMENERVIVRDVFPNTAAARAGLQQGDFILTIDGKAVASTGDFTGPLSRRSAGDEVMVEYERGGKRAPVKLALLERPREKHPDYDAVYGEVSADGQRFRTIATKPKSGAAKATLFLVQGLGCSSIDNPPPGHSYIDLIASLSRRGFATFRVDKPGAGDSEGGPCPAVDYHGEVKAFRAALASLKDTQNVFLFGHSMGGIQAPLIAEGFPLRGVIAYGATFKSWAHYIVANQRRQMRMSGVPFEDMEEEEKRSERFNALFYVQKQPLEKIIAEHPEFKERFPDGKTYAGGKEGRFFQQLYDVPMAAAWKKIEAPVLSLYGASDFLTEASEHEALAAAVSSWRPGTAKFVTLQGVDHWIRKAADQQASMSQGPGGSEYDDRLAETVAAFMSEHSIGRHGIESR